MIVPMKHLTVLTRAADRTAALERLRDLGVVHLAAAAPETARVREALERVQEAERAAALVIAAAREDRPDTGGVAAPVAPAVTDPGAILALGREQEAAETELQALERDEARYAPFGDFDPADAAALAASGVPVTLFKAPCGTILDSAAEAPSGNAAETPRLRPVPDNTADGPFRTLLHETHEGCFGVQLGAGDFPEGFEKIAPPARRLADLRASHAAARERIADARRRLAASAAALDALRQQRDARADAYDFAAAYEGMAANDALAWLTGYVPAEAFATVLDAARRQGWGVLSRDPEAYEAVPTLLRPPRLFAPFLRVFAFLGINPAYTESDISGPFYIFFTIFFAMLIGDAGYGLILLAGILLARRKAAKLPAGVFTLFTVFAVATIAWGVLSACYFGIKPELLPGPLNHGAARWLAEQNNIMLVCFALGAAHMSLGHAWNALCLFPDSRFVAQVGWCGVVATMFCATSAVVGIFAFPKFMMPVAAASVLLIILFMLKRSELKTRGVELGMLPLNIISTLGDVISYVRLFAVATASVQLAGMFNKMAVDLALPLPVKIPAMALILLLGHGMNLAMGALSILVHGVRLNTLEFSNHKGITWSGFAYKPFRRRVPAS